MKLIADNVYLGINTLKLFTIHSYHELSLLSVNRSLKFLKEKTHRQSLVYPHTVIALKLSYNSELIRYSRFRHSSYER